MTRFINLQTNFTSGEIDPLLRARIDLKQYENACEKLTNVIVQPQGGVKRRAGSKYITEISNASSGARLVPFEFSVTDSYMLCFTNNQMAVFKDGVLITNINSSGNAYLDTSSVGLTGSRLNIICYTQSADTMIIVHPDINPVKLVRGANDASWTISAITFDSIPFYAFTQTFTNPAATLTADKTSGTVKVTASASVFTSGSVGQYINATPQGRMRITAYDSGTVVRGITEIPFFDTNAIASGSWEVEGGYEAVWSSTKGWPRTVTFHEGRLFFGGSKSRVSTVWGSKVGLFFDFRPDSGYEDDALEATLDTNQLNIIVDIISGRDLQLFTTGAEFYVPQSGLDPITPTNFFVKTASKNGCKEGTRVQQLDGSTIYLQRQGKSLNEFLYTDTEATYTTQRVSLLSSHLMKSPKRLALRKATSTDEGDLLLIPNVSDGTLAVYTILRSQQIVAASEFITDGTYEEVGVDVTDIYALVKRTVSGTNRYFIELFTDGTYTDCNKTGGAASGASSLPLNGKTVNVIADGVVLEDEVVASGSVTFERPAATSYEVGLPFVTQIKTMPVEVKTTAGVRTSFRKRIVEVNAIVFQTQHFVINDKLVTFKKFGEDTLDRPEPTYTGIKELEAMLGYTKEAYVNVTQTLPLKMTLLGLEYKVATYAGT
jgi:hypothetical protein